MIHKHAARNLHYDFRLSVGNILKSWAIPKGPSTNPSNKRLAIMVDDHAIKYGNFEGVLPKGIYGAGTVMIWDNGTYRNLRKKNGKVIPIQTCLREGLVKIWLNGKKLKGGYVLVHLNKEKWMLIKMRDKEANSRKNITKSEPKSAKTGRTMQEIKKEESGKTKKIKIYGK